MSVTHLRQEIKLANSEFPFDEAHVSKLLEEIIARRGEFKEQRHISQDIIEQLRELGIYRSCVPEIFGGTPLAPSKILKLVERLAVADGSTAWVASFAVTINYLSALPEQTLKTIFSETPDVILAGATFPIQPAKRVEGGIIVNGRWPFGSGCMNADMIVVGVRIEGEENAKYVHMAVIPAEKIKIEQTWKTIGMSATGSHHMVVEDVFVTDDWLILRDAPATVDVPEYKYPTITYAAQGLAICAVGAAQAAMDHIVNVAKTSKSITGAPTLGDRTNVQIHIAECEAKLQAARSWFYAAADEAWQTIESGQELSRKEKLALRLSASHAARTGAEVARACFEMVGTMGIFSDHPLSTYLTDALVTAQHAFLTEGSFMNAGKVMFEHPTIPGYC